MLPLKQQRLAVIQACITPMYRRHGSGIIITITVALHNAFVIKRTYVGDLSWRRLFLVRLRSSKILYTACPGSQGIEKLESHDLGSDGCLRVAYEISFGSPPLAQWITL